MVRGTFSPARAWRPAVVARLARTLGLVFNHLCQTLPSVPTVTDDQPEYSISEFVLCGLFLGGAICFFIYAGYSFYNEQTYDAMEGTGLGLLLLGGSTDPKKYLIDCVTFPATLIESSGRDTSLTILAALLGTGLWLAGLAGNWFF